jgi:hypothetical protein
MTPRSDRPTDRQPIDIELALLLTERETRQPPQKPKRIDGDDGSDDDLFDNVPV